MDIRFARLLATITLAMSFVVGARAQENATITGTIADPSGAVIANAKITLANPSTSQERTATSNSSGLYIFSNVGVGRFNLSVAGTGFQSYIKRDIVVNVDQSLREDVTLAIGSAAQEVTIQANALQV